MKTALAILAGGLVALILGRVIRDDPMDCAAITRRLGHHPASMEVDGVCINGHGRVC